MRMNRTQIVNGKPRVVHCNYTAHFSAGSFTKKHKVNPFFDTYTNSINSEDKLVVLKVQNAGFL